MLLGAILAAYSQANPRLLRVEQFRDGLAVRSAAPGDPLHTGGAQLFTDHVFAPGKPVLLTIASDGRGTHDLVNGILRRAVPGFQICHALLAGKLVAGTGAESDYGWPGRLAGIAIISRPLWIRRIGEDYNTWPNHPGPGFSNRLGLAALYLFDEGSGARVRDEVSGANSCLSDRYVVVAKPFLSRPSSTTTLTWWPTSLASFRSALRFADICLPTGGKALALLRPSYWLGYSAC